MQDASTAPPTLERAAIQAHLDGLTKPPGSLGRLERLAARLCEIQDSLSPQSGPRCLVVFAADHGVVAEGVSAWPASVTTLMIDNIRAGGAACCALAKAAKCELRLVDVGSAGPEREPGPGFRVARVAAGTANLAQGPAMSVDQLEQALEIGREEARRALTEDHRVLLAGEMGIGNSTSAAALSMWLAEIPLEEAVGRGAGVDDEGLRVKREIVERAVARARAQTNLRAGLAELAGFEIAAIAGFYQEAHEGGATVVVDGAIATAGALIAAQFDSDVTSSMIAAHCSVEPAHAHALRALGLEPFLDWELRLGEGTGALLLLPMMDAAAAMTGEMATLASLGLDG